MRDAWQQASENLEKVLSKQDFSTWIKPITYCNHDDTTVCLSVPTVFFKEWIEDHYKQILISSFEITAGKKYAIDFIITEKESDVAIFNTEDLIVKSNQENNLLNSQIDSIFTSLNPKYTFELFVSGAGNQFAHAAAMAVADNPATSYNPLFIYGGVGLGKSHLLNAIGHAIRSASPDLKLCYCSAEKFMYEMVNSLRQKKMDQFKSRFRNLDVFLVDDIQFISGKPSTQEEFFHTFNALYDMQKQIVITSDKFPREISDLEERLRSRFEWGLIADIQPPDLETKIAILKKKSEINKIRLPEDVIYFLASSDTRNIRELEGMLIRLGAYGSLQGIPITLDMAKHNLKDILGDGRKDVTVDLIQKIVSEYFNIKPTDLKSSKRLKNFVQARQIAIWLSRDMTSLSYPDIGSKFGGKDHSTVIYATKKIDAALKNDSKLYKTIEELKQNILK